MSRLRLVTFAAAVALLAASCGRLGVGLPGCEAVVHNPTTANLLSLQAVPGANYAPCINSLKLGWDDVAFKAESGQATIEVGRGLVPFLEVRLTESCDIGNATEVASNHPDVKRYEDIAEVGGDIGVAIIPTGERPLIHARSMVEAMPELRIDDRLVVFSVNEKIDFSTRTRVNEALFTNDYVWIITDLDIDEGTLELRRTPDGEGARGLSVDDAVDLIEDMTPEPSYTGYWYLVFDGGCITYEFDAKGPVAESLGQDAGEAFGLYPNAELREIGETLGYNITDG